METKESNMFLFFRQDVLDWLQDFCNGRYLHTSQINIHGFAALNGSKLQKMTSEDFMNIDNYYGAEIFKALLPYRGFKSSGKQKYPINNNLV